MDKKRCSISLKVMDAHLMVNINDTYYFDPKALKELIRISYLGIDINLASEEEWVITSLNDKLNHSGISRLRNPLTNLPFSSDELKIIYRNLSLYGDNNIRITRNKAVNIVDI